MVILHMQLRMLRYQRRKSLIITCQSCLIFGLSMKDEYCDLSLLYFRPQLHNCPCNIAKWFIKPLSKTLTAISTAVKTGSEKILFFLGVVLIKCGY